MVSGDVVRPQRRVDREPCLRRSSLAATALGSLDVRCLAQMRRIGDQGAATDPDPAQTADLMRRPIATGLSSRYVEARNDRVAKPYENATRVARPVVMSASLRYRPSM